MVSGLEAPPQGSTNGNLTSIIVGVCALASALACLWLHASSRKQLNIMSVARERSEMERRLIEATVLRTSARRQELEPAPPLGLDEATCISPSQPAPGMRSLRSGVAQAVPAVPEDVGGASLEDVAGAVSIDLPCGLPVLLPSSSGTSGGDTPPGPAQSAEPSGVVSLEAA
eukprot:1051796-Prymnesium_polylepis.1